MADAFAEELLTDGGDIGDDEIFQVLQEIFEASALKTLIADQNPERRAWSSTGMARPQGACPQGPGFATLSGRQQVG